MATVFPGRTGEAPRRPAGARRAGDGTFHLTVDIEGFYHAQNVQPFLTGGSGRHEDSSPIEAQVELLLELLGQSAARATLFVLGDLARRHGPLVRRLADAGHEIASHGMTHRLLNRLPAADRRYEIAASKRLLEDVTGAEVAGFRAPCFSIDDASVEMLAEAGYRYDSSLLPTSASDRPGTLAGLGPERRTGTSVHGSGILEFPLQAWRMGGLHVPFCGGAYCRFLPGPIVRRAIADRLRDGRRFVFYVHPWELMLNYALPDAMPAQKRLRHTFGIGKVAPLLRRLLAVHRSETLGSAACREAAPHPRPAPPPWAAGAHRPDGPRGAGEGT